MQIRLYYIYTIYTWLYGLHVQIIIIIILPLLLAIRFDYLKYHRNCGFRGNPDSGIQGNFCSWNKGCWALECTKSQKFDVLVMCVYVCVCMQNV